MARPLLLLSNDDGFRAPGLRALVRALHSVGDVVVVAPERNQSAVSHGLTLSQVLRVRRVGEGRFALGGTPADCIYVALNGGARMLPRRPDLVISGINEGPNLGVDVNYSGTVAAAREAALRGIPAMAVSSAIRSAIPTAAAVAQQLATALLERKSRNRQPRTLLLNVNVPRVAPEGIRVTTLGTRTYADDVVERVDPRGRPYFWIGSADLGQPDGDGRLADTRAFHEGWISVTPLSVDSTAGADRPFVQRLLARRR